MYKNSYLRKESLSSISIFHQPQCFETSKPESVVEKWKNRFESLQSITVEPSKNKPIDTKFTLPLASHSLDSSWACRRRYWLNSISNWEAEQLEFVPSSEVKSEWPKATEFGSLFHRLLEIGLPNPGSESKNLDRSWKIQQNDKLTIIKS